MMFSKKKVLKPTAKSNQGGYEDVRVTVVWCGDICCTASLTEQI